MTRYLIPAAIFLSATLVMIATVRDARTASAGTIAPSLPVSMPGTSREALSATVRAMTERLAAHPDNAPAVLALTNALVRLQRVNNDGRAVIVAEEHLRAFQSRHPENYEARRMLGAVLLSQHRFADAIGAANKAMAIDPQDAWNYGVAGDGYLELGDYPRAFASFDRMGQLQPGPPAYARTSYALEIQGDLDGALDYLQRAAQGISPNDAESQAWHFAQLGDLLVKLGRVPQARIEYERADATFPGHPMAVAGLARIKMLDGDLKGARLALQTQLARTATPDLAMAIAELSLAMDDAAQADQYYRMAEQIERGGWSSGRRQPEVMARLLAERPGRSAEAADLAKEAARGRDDIFTLDTLAWSYFKNGQLQEARAASARAMRTGTREPRIVCHAEVIEAEHRRRSSPVASKEAQEPATSSREPASTRRCLEWHP